MRSAQHNGESPGLGCIHKVRNSRTAYIGLLIQDHSEYDYIDRGDLILDQLSYSEMLIEYGIGLQIEIVDMGRNGKCVCISVCLHACVCLPVVKAVETIPLVSNPLAACNLTVYSVVSASPSRRIQVSSASRISSCSTTHTHTHQGTGTMSGYGTANCFIQIQS